MSEQSSTSIAGVFFANNSGQDQAAPLGAVLSGFICLRDIIILMFILRTICDIIRQPPLEQSDQISYCMLPW